MHVLQHHVCKISWRNKTFLTPATSNKHLKEHLVRNQLRLYWFNFMYKKDQKKNRFFKNNFINYIHVCLNAKLSWIAFKSCLSRNELHIITMLLKLTTYTTVEPSSPLSFVKPVISLIKSWELSALIHETPVIYLYRVGSKQRKLYLFTAPERTTSERLSAKTCQNIVKHKNT